MSLLPSAAATSELTRDLAETAAHPLTVLRARMAVHRGQHSALAAAFMLPRLNLKRIADVAALCSPELRFTVREKRAGSHTPQ